MKRLSRGLPTALALITLAAIAVAPAQARAKVKHHHGLAPKYAPADRRYENFPVYEDHGSDRNPGGDNLYFTDTKNPHYVVGPAWFQRWEDR